MPQVVLKTAKNHKNNILWQALYIDSKKMLENYSIDIDKALQAFEIENETLIKLIAHENNKLRIQHIFPEEDGFKQLDYNEEYELEEKQLVWISNYQNYNYNIKGGKVTVKKVHNTPVSKMLWDTDFIKKTVTWFSCKEVAGLFCWTKLVKMQPQLKEKFGNRFAIISKKAPPQK